MKGANYIPPDMFMPRVTKEVYERTLNNAKVANFNMLRVWGGGNYENDTFYDLCDEKGILVWQDFMFANTMFPGSDDLFSNIKQEVTEQVKRLRNHASIAMWVGNNEIEEGWNNWGWKDCEYSDQILDWYQQIFNTIIPSVLKTHDTSRGYYPSSPRYGWGNELSYKIADSHYWGVWVGKADIESFNTKFGRFSSEWGMQGFLPMSSIERFSLPTDWSLDSSVMLLHERHATKFESIKYFVYKYYKEPIGFEKFVYVSALMQGLTLKTAIESHRRNMPYSMGTLVWQLNDVWPVISWSTYDYYGTRKAGYYTQKRVFKNVISSVYNNQVYVISDKLFDFQGHVTIKVMNFKGDTLKAIQLKSLTIKERSSQVIYTFDNKFINSLDKASTFIHIVIEYPFEDWFSENFYYLANPIDLSLAKPNINFTFDNKENLVSLRSDVLVKDVLLYCDGKSLQFDDNYFDLAPNIVKTVKLFDEPLEQVHSKLKILSLIDSYN